MKSIIEKIFGVHDTQLRKTGNTYMDKLGILFGILMMIGAPIFFISINEKVTVITEQKQMTAVFFIEKIDKDYVKYLDTGKYPDKPILTDKERCIVDRFVDRTELEIEFFKKIIYIFSILLFLGGFDSVKRGWYSLKVKKLMQF